MERGFLYLVAIMDWYSRFVLDWELSNTLGACFCVEVLERTLSRRAPPKIFNTDQGSQFTSTDFLQPLKDNDIAISMDGKGRVFGGRSSMSTSTCIPTRAAKLSIMGSQNTSISTIHKECIRLLETRLQRPSTMVGSRWRRTLVQNSSRPTGSFRSAPECEGRACGKRPKTTRNQQPGLYLNFVHFLSRQTGPLQLANGVS